jgi:hypothetical protein
MASRWPLVVALSAWALALTSIQVLRAPIPIAIPRTKPFPVTLVGDIKIESLEQPVRIEGTQPLSIRAASALPVQGNVAVKGDVAVSQSVPIEGSVTVKAIESGVKVQTEDATPIAVKVNGAVNVEEVGGKVNVQLKNAVRSVLPVP